jgi:hypothetical protein
MAAFHHELFHSLQRNITQMHGGNGDVDGPEDTWQFFSEGTAAMVPSVGQPGVQFDSSHAYASSLAYVSHANRYMSGTGTVGDLNTSYAGMSPYYAAMYWRFLYEQCGGMRDGIEDPTAGMQVIKRALTVLYSGEVVDIGSSTDLIGALPGIMEWTFEGSACPFTTYRESLIRFTSAMATLRLEGGRCTAPGIPAGCGFYDPNGAYRDPPLSTITYAGSPITYAGVDQPFPAGVSSSFGVDFVDVILDPASNGRPLTFDFYGASGAEAEFDVQLWKLMDLGGGAQPQRVPSHTAAPEVLMGADGDGHMVYTIEAIDTTAYNRLGLIITRVDAQESSDRVGAYTIVLRAHAESD